MNDIVKTKPGTAVATTARNPFTDYGNSGSSEHIYGPLLKFVKGDWVTGEDQTEVPLGTKFIAVMDKMALGWIRWENKKPSDQVMALVASGGAPRRADCGELDKLQWPVDAVTGEHKDPWQQQTYIPLINVKTHEVFTFASSSHGGRNAGKKLSAQYGKRGANEYPVVTLETDSYIHEEYGKTKVPLFTVTSWLSDKDRFNALLLAGAAAADGDTEEEFENPGQGLDDEISF